MMNTYRETATPIPETELVRLTEDHLRQRVSAFSWRFSGYFLKVLYKGKYYGIYEEVAPTYQHYTIEVDMVNENGSLYPRRRVHWFTRLCIVYKFRKEIALAGSAIHYSH